MFKEERTHSLFSWKDLGDISAGRPNLGSEVPVAVYRLLQYTLHDVLIQELDVTQARDLFIKAGELAGEQFACNLLDLDKEPGEFIAQLQQVLKDLKVGILRVEKADLEALEFILTVAEDLDCSGLPVTDETICHYDEGFIAGIFKAYTGKPFHAEEVDCWASGDRVCRFEAKVLSEETAWEKTPAQSCNN